MARRGNPGYGKMENIRQHVDKFAPVFWQLMEEMAQSKSKDDKKFFIQEFNKIQTKMIPTEVGGIGGEPIAITWQPSLSPIVPGNGQSTSTIRVDVG
jgi:hypothetical protein